MSRATGFTESELREVLDSVMDPEVPVLSVVELGIVRDVAVAETGDVTVSITPTYSGCPAMQVIERDIVEALRSHGVERVAVRTVYSPAWTSDWIAPDAREKLRAYGIAPPGAMEHDAPVQIGKRRPTVRCPYCSSMQTSLTSEFGSTSCKAIHVCQSCRQPFEEFKAI